MNTIIDAHNINKVYGNKKILNDVSFTIEKGKIVGLIGPNGAGKTTLLRCLLGLAKYHGDISILGLDPLKQRAELMRDICFIADTAVLPPWIKVKQVVSYMQDVHPNFNREKAEEFLEKTRIEPNQRINQLSKGMVTQLHLALVMAIDAKLLVLDEPTLGLDILYRKHFYEQLLNDYFDENRTILVTTHQVEEIEAILSDLIFIRDGEFILNTSMESLSEQFVEVEVTADNLAQARELKPISERTALGRSIMLFENIEVDTVRSLGVLRTPSISDLFVAKMKAY